MDRYRLNQILEVLLFPVCDPGLAARDCFFEEYNAYHHFQEIQGYGAAETKKRAKQEKKFKRAEKELLEYLAERENGNVRSYDDLQLLCQLYYPLKKIWKKCRTLQKPATKETMTFFYMENLSRIAKSLLTYRDGNAAIKTWKNDGEDDIFDFSTIFNKVEIWNLLERMTVPDIYIAIFAVESGNGREVLHGQKGSISLADKLLHQKLEKGLAENHIHFNAGYRYEVLWLHEMNLIKWQEGTEREIDREESRLLQAALFRCAAAVYLEECRKGECAEFKEWMIRNCRGEVRASLKRMHEDQHIDKITMPFGKDIAEFYHCVVSAGNIEEYDYLLESVYAEDMELRTTSEMIFLYKAYRHVWQDAGFAYYFVQYLRIKNIFFRQLQEMHEVKGLVFFQNKYNHARDFMRTGAGEEEAMIESFRSQNGIQSLRKLEIRIAPPGIGEITWDSYGACREILLEELYEKVHKVLYAYRRCILENIMGIRGARVFLAAEQEGAVTKEQWGKIFADPSVKTVNVPSVGIVFHFLKAKDLNDTSGYFCWRNVWKGERLNAKHRIATRWYMQYLSRAIQEMRVKIPFLSEYIVGIDAASDENAMEPWMFAPAYRVMHEERNAKIVADGCGFQNVQNMRFTYHVGEDFRHILSGLRHIDEVMRAFHYRTGDRLGHAITLGIDIDQWIRENEVVPMPIGEYLENLLWVWGQNTCEGVQLPVQLEALESKIMDIAEKLYHHSEELTVRMLYQAYKKKFEDHSREDIKEWIGEEIGAQPCKNSTPGDHFCYYQSEGACYGHWTAERLCLTNYCPVFAEKYNEVCLVPVQKQEAELWKTLQRNLIVRTERLGVFVETNPTSNLTIGDFSQMRDHPLFRLSAIDSDDGNHVQIMVNSDDPAVFNTNVENELAYIYYAAEYQGYSKERVLTWVDGIRQNGMDGSFVLKEKEPGQILREVGQMLEALRNRKGIRGGRDYGIITEDNLI